MTLKLKTPSNGSVTLAPQDTASDVVLTVPSTAGSFVTANSSGNVGIGVTPSAWEASTTLQLGNNYSYSKYGMGRNYYYDGSANRYITSAAAGSYQISGSGVHAWSIAPSGTAGNTISFTQAMTLDASGNLLVGTTSAVGNGKIQAKGVSGVRACMSMAVGGNGDSGVDWYNASNAYVGSIVVNASSIAYNTASDYRLKEQVTPMTGALAKNDLLNPVTYKWKADGSDGQGFIAHELQAVFPDAVTGEKDAVDADGNPQYQGVDTSFLVAHLVACVQEQQAMITQLQSRIEALENA